MKKRAHSGSGLRHINSKQRRKLRQRIWQEQHGLCAMCSKPVEYEKCTIDHITPVALYDRSEHYLFNKRYNLRMTCARCNYKKGDKNELIR